MHQRNRQLYDQEASEWMRALEMLQQENIRMKNGIAEAIKNDKKEIPLDKAENLLNDLINKEAVIALLRFEITEQVKSSYNERTEDKRNKLREDIVKMQLDFKKLQLDMPCQAISSSRH